MRTTFAILLTVAACNHDAPTSAQGSGSAQGSAASPAPEPTPGSDDEGPPSKTLPGAGLPGGLRGEPKSGAAKLSDLGVDIDNWPGELRPRWLSDQSMLVSILRKPVMIAKLSAPTAGLIDGTAMKKDDTVMCERTLRGATYHVEATNLDEDAATMLAKFCAALK